MQESGRSRGLFRRERPVPGNRLHCGPSVQNEKDLCKKAGGPVDLFAGNGPCRGTACTAGRVRRVRRTYARKRVVPRIVSQGTVRAGELLALRAECAENDGGIRRQRPRCERRSPASGRIGQPHPRAGTATVPAGRTTQTGGRAASARNIRRFPSAGAAAGSPERRQTLINRSDGPYSVS